MSSPSLESRAQNWLQSVKDQLVSSAMGRWDLVGEGVDMGHELLSELRTKMADRYEDLEGDDAKKEELLTRTACPEGDSWGEGLEAATEVWALRVLGDEVESAWDRLVDEGGKNWAAQHGGGFPGYPVLGRALRALRVARGFGQAKLAKLAGISKPMVSHVETFRRERRVSLEVLDAWVSACGLNLELGLQSSRPETAASLSPHLEEVVERWSKLDQRQQNLVESAAALALAHRPSLAAP